MNSLHKKRQSFRQSIRSRSIQQLFARKRQQLMNELKQQSISNQTSSHYGQKLYSHTTIGRLFQSHPQNVFTNIKHFLSTLNHIITSKDQQLLFSQINSNKYNMSSLQKVYLLSKLINREQFNLNQQIQTQYGWKNIINQFLTVILNDQQIIKRDIMIGQHQKLGSFNKNISHQSHIKKATFLNMICFSLLKIWEIKPKYEYFLALTKAYPIIYQKISGQLSLTLIAELSYDRSLLPNYSFVTKLLETNIKNQNEIKFFRTLQILKNFITQFKVQNDHQIHPRQLIFEYFNWFKIQVNLLLDEESQIILEKEKQEKSHFQLHIHEETSSETRYFLIYLLFTILNKLSQVNQKQRQYLHNKEILLLNEQLFNFKENHTLLKFLILQGKQSQDPHHKKNILRTLSFLISFLQTVSAINHKKQQQNEYCSTSKQLQFGAQLQEIERTFQGTDLDWFGSFN